MTFLDSIVISLMSWFLLGRNKVMENVEGCKKMRLKIKFKGKKLLKRKEQFFHWIKISYIKCQKELKDVEVENLIDRKFSKGFVDFFYKFGYFSEFLVLLKFDPIPIMKPLHIHHNLNILATNFFHFLLYKKNLSSLRQLTAHKTL